MIHNHKLLKLTDDELTVLLYIVNNECKTREFTVESLCWLRPKWVYQTLNAWVDKIKEEHKSLLQSIVDKVV